MSVLDGYNKYKRHILTNEGYKLCSQWTSSNTVEMDDGNTLQTNLGAINGITDSLTATSSNIAASAAAVKALNDSLTSELVNKITITASGFTNNLVVSESNGIAYVTGGILFTSTNLVNGLIGLHTFNLKYNTYIPVFAYGNGYIGGFGMLTFSTNGVISLLAYSNGNIESVYCNGCIILN